MQNKYKSASARAYINRNKKRGAKPRKYTRKPLNTRTKPALFQKQKENVAGMAGAGTFTTYSYKHKMTKWAKGLKKATPNYTYSNNQGLTLTCNGGTQGCGVVSQMFTYNDTVKLFQQVIDSSESTNTNVQKMYIEGCSQIGYFTNNTNAPVAMDIYDCIYRVNIVGQTQKDPLYLWDYGIQTTNNGSVPSGLTYTYQVVGCTPFQSPWFTAGLKICKVSKVQLPQGGTHEHRINIRLNRFFNGADFSLLGGANTAVGDYTRFTIVVVRGFPVDQGASSVTVSTAPCKVDMVWTTKYNMCGFQSSCAETFIDNTIPYNMSTPTIINIGSGATTTFATA